MPTQAPSPKNLLTPIVIMIIGLVSAFVFAPITAQKSLQHDYRVCLYQWQELQNKAQKEMFSWIAPNQLLKEKEDFENIEKSIAIVQEQYNSTKNEKSIAKLAEIQKNINKVQMSIISYETSNKNKLEAKKQVAQKLKELQKKSKNNETLTESIESLIKASTLPDKHKNILLDSIAAVKKRTKALRPVLEAVASYYTPEYENKALMDFKSAEKFLTTNDQTSLWIEHISQTLMQTSTMLKNFDKAEQIVPPALANYQTTFQAYQKELYNPAQPAVLKPNAAMKKADYLLTVSNNLLRNAQEKAQNQEFVEAYVILEQLAPVARQLDAEYNYQKKSYEEFGELYEAIQKDLKEVEKAKLEDKQKNEIRNNYNEALLAHQMALNYAMAGNWAMAKIRLQESENKSAKAYQVAFRNTSKPSYTSSYNNKRYSSDDYSSSGSNSNSNNKSNRYSSKKSSSSSSSSSKSNSYSSSSSSSRKSDSRSWGSSSSSSKKSSSSRSSSRRSDSRSWGSRSSGRKR